MFNRKFVTETKLVNTKKQTPTSIRIPSPPKAPTLIDKINKKVLVDAAVGLVAVYVAVKTTNTLSTIAVNYCPKN